MNAPPRDICKWKWRIHASFHLSVVFFLVTGILKIAPWFIEKTHIKVTLEFSRSHLDLPRRHNKGISFFWVNEKQFSVATTLQAVS